MGNFFQNTRAFVLALIVHALLFSLIALNLNFIKSAKPVAQAPMQAIVLNEVPEPLPLLEPEPEPEKVPEPVIEEIKKPELEPIIEEKPKPKLKPKEKFEYECDGKVYEVDSKAEADRLQVECDEKIKAKKKLEKKKKQEEIKRKQQEEKKREEEKLKKKKLEEKQQLEEKKRKEELEKEKERKKKAAAEKKRKAEAEKQRKLDEERKKKIAEQKRKADAARKKAEADLQAQISAENAKRIEGEAGTAMGFAQGPIQSAIESNWRETGQFGLEAVLRIQVGRSGEVLSVRVVRSSGDQFFDREAEIAVKKASPLPIPLDPRYYPFIKEFQIRFAPNG